jgi:hypothetical protein
VRKSFCPALSLGREISAVERDVNRLDEELSRGRLGAGWN